MSEINFGCLMYRLLVSAIKEVEDDFPNYIRTILFRTIL